MRGTQPGTNKEDITTRKAYAVAQSSEILDISDFAKHITMHGSVYGKADIVAVLTTAVSCLRELCLEGKRVKLGDLGAFQAQISSEGADTAAEFTANNITDVNIRWTPGDDFKNLRSEATFQLVNTREVQAKDIEVIKGTKTVVYTDVPEPEEEEDDNQF